jgi:F0F1-type ATP synthase assembly protein I
MQNQNRPFGDRIRSFAYVFLSGLLVGVIIGWMMHGLIGFVIRAALFILAVALVVGAIMFWQNTRRSAREPYDPRTVETTWREPRDRR